MFTLNNVSALYCLVYTVFMHCNVYGTQCFYTIMFSIQYVSAIYYVCSVYYIYTAIYTIKCITSLNTLFIVIKHTQYRVTILYTNAYSTVCLKLVLYRTPCLITLYILTTAILYTRLTDALKCIFEK